MKQLIVGNLAGGEDDQLGRDFPAIFQLDIEFRAIQRESIGRYDDPVFDDQVDSELVEPVLDDLV